MKKIITIHNPTNFEPSDYEVIDYLDNRPPQFSPMWGLGLDEEQRRAADQSAREIRERWLAEWKQFFATGPQHRCAHCGNGSIRYVAVCLHRPTGTHVAFGDICVARLNFTNHDEFRAEKIRSHASNELARFKRETAMAKTIEDHPDFGKAYALLQSKPAGVEFSFFVSDIAHKFVRYGELSDKQISAFTSAVTRDVERVQKRAEEAAACGPVPTGRVDIEGEVLTVKLQESMYGDSLKMLLKLANGSKIWLTVPSSLPGVDRGMRVALTVTVEASEKDPSFGFGKRPTKARIVTGEDPSSEDGEVSYKAAALDRKQQRAWLDRNSATRH